MDAVVKVFERSDGASHDGAAHVAFDVAYRLGLRETLELSRLNVPPDEIVVYASRAPSPAHAQHSLPGARYGLPAPVFHRLGHASLPGAQANSLIGAR
jgi:hypothetical protein